MVNGFTIELSEPICHCGIDHVQWLMSSGGLTFICQQCKTNMYVSIDELMVTFSYQVVPETVVTKKKIKQKYISKNVIEFPRKK
jgi:hypothetical protein